MQNEAKTVKTGAVLQDTTYMYIYTSNMYMCIKNKQTKTSSFHGLRSLNLRVGRRNCACELMNFFIGLLIPRTKPSNQQTRQRTNLIN